MNFYFLTEIVYGKTTSDTIEPESPDSVTNSDTFDAVALSATVTAGASLPGSDETVRDKDSGQQSPTLRSTKSKPLRPVK